MADLHRLELIDDGPQGVNGFKLALDGFELKGVSDYTLYGPLDEPWKELVITLHVESVNAPSLTSSSTSTVDVRSYPPGTPMVTNWDRTDAT